MGQAASTIQDTHDGSQDILDDKVIVMGSGNFGTCLADHLATLGNQVTVWARDERIVHSINSDNKNCRYLSEVTLSKNLKATQVLDAELFATHSVVLMSVPTQFMRSILQTIKPFLELRHLIIFVNKGIECSSLQLPSEIVLEELGPDMGGRACFLSGPSFAIEVVTRQPTCVAVASLSAKRAHRCQRLFHSPCFRVYDIQDTVGLEIAGALKNVIAIASGAASGAGYQANARAAIITRGLAEITRFGHTAADRQGDLFLTCTSEKSRNFTVGYRLGKGEKLKDIVESLGSVAEGVPTTKAAYDLARKYNVDTPITDEVYRVLYEDKDIMLAFKDLTERDPSHELRGIADQVSILRPMPGQ
ncbi:hypothetical protein HDU91_003845 [Kappamyces sp. JEL0680]|nr:hypothetical protein HDU91_003845 [Kappamyces sp. JEL0680]